jgi:hypothetical protein
VGLLEGQQLGWSPLGSAVDAHAGLGSTPLLRPGLVLGAADPGRVDRETPPSRLGCGRPDGP